MHPAPSVIFFTTFSGLGFGLLFFLGLGVVAPVYWAAFAWFFIAYAFAVGGLMASTFHLGRPERAYKAFSQWRSSWLSREGVCAVASLVFMGMYAFGLTFLGAKWTLFGLLGAVTALGTVFTTSMIYTQLKTVPRWNHWSTPSLFLLISLAGGALLSGQTTLASLLLLVSGALQVFTWWQGEQRLAQSGTNMKTATGLGFIGEVRAFEPPHTGSNYLMREFIYQVGRKHALKLQALALVFGFILPVLLLMLPFNHFLGVLAVISHIGGILTLRWLFFAQAEHVVGLYYGKRMV